METLIKHKFIFVCSLLSLAFAGGGFLWVSLALRSAGNQLILHFGDITGITSIGNFETLGFMGVLGILIVIINAALAFELESRDVFWGKLIAVLTLLFSVLLFIGFASIIRVN